MDQPVFLDEKIDTIYQFYKEERARIERATEESGVYYILRNLFEALSLNTRARSVTRTVTSELVREEIRRQDRLIEISNNHIVSAIYKIIQQERGEC